MKITATGNQSEKQYSFGSHNNTSEAHVLSLASLAAECSSNLFLVFSIFKQMTAFKVEVIRYGRILVQ
jgi:hypothetical protein